MSEIILFKALAAPLLILGLTLLIRRFGPVIGGLAMGIPLVTGPISVFTALEYGAEFASQSAITNLVGQISGCVFCVVYARLAINHRPWVSATYGVVFFFGATMIWSLIDWTLLYAILLLVICLPLLALAIPQMPHINVLRITPWWDLPMRMVVASCFVLAITYLTGHLGSQLSGLIAPFPVFVLILAVFTHLHYGGESVAIMMRGVILGSPAFGVFFVVVAIGLVRFPIPVVYICATLACVIVSGSVYWFFYRSARH